MSDKAAAETPESKAVVAEAKPRTKVVDSVGLCTWFYVEMAGEGYRVLAETAAYAQAIVEAHRADKKVQRVGLLKAPPVRGEQVLVQAPPVQVSETSPVKDQEAAKARPVNYVATSAY